MSTKSVKVCLLPSALTYYDRHLTGQNAAVYTITSNLLPLALHQNLKASSHVKTSLTLNIRTRKSKTLSHGYSPPTSPPPFKSGPWPLKEKMASPLDYDPKFSHYWSEHPRDSVWGKHQCLLLLIFWVLHLPSHPP